MQLLVNRNMQLIRIEVLIIRYIIHKQICRYLYDCFVSVVGNNIPLAILSRKKLEFYNNEKRVWPSPRPFYVHTTQTVAAAYRYYTKQTSYDIIILIYIYIYKLCLRINMTRPFLCTKFQTTVLNFFTIFFHTVVELLKP